MASTNIDSVSRGSESDSAHPPEHLLVDGTWSACQTNVNPDAKELIAKYFARHDFLVRRGHNGEKDSKQRAAHFLVAPGTTPNTVVSTCLDAMKANWSPSPYTVTWYPLGALIPATLFEFKRKNPHCNSAARLFLIPGEVDPQSESVTGKYPVDFLKTLDIRLNGSILSAHRFDMTKGQAYFYFGNEAEVQRAGARVYAEDKFLFLDHLKFSWIAGTPVYSVKDLLQTSQSVTIYTLTSESDGQLKNEFSQLCSSLDMHDARDLPNRESYKRLRLCIVRSDGEIAEDVQTYGQAS